MEFANHKNDEDYSSIFKLLTMVEDKTAYGYGKISMDNDEILKTIEAIREEHEKPLLARDFIAFLDLSIGFNDLKAKSQNEITKQAFKLLIGCKYYG